MKARLTLTGVTMDDAGSEGPPYKTAEKEVELRFVPIEGMWIDFGLPDDTDLNAKVGNVTWNLNEECFEVLFDARMDNDSLQVLVENHGWKFRD